MRNVKWWLGLEWSRFSVKWMTDQKRQANIDAKLMQKVFFSLESARFAVKWSTDQKKECKINFLLPCISSYAACKSLSLPDENSRLQYLTHVLFYKKPIYKKLHLPKPKIYETERALPKYLRNFLHTKPKMSIFSNLAWKLQKIKKIIRNF